MEYFFINLGPERMVRLSELFGLGTMVWPEKRAFCYHTQLRAGKESIKIRKISIQREHIIYQDIALQILF